jgi:hypothetical protein
MTSTVINGRRDQLEGNAKERLVQDTALSDVCLIPKSEHWAAYR